MSNRFLSSLYFPSPTELTSLPRTRDCQSVTHLKLCSLPDLPPCWLRRGVTLLELLVVLTLMGVAAAVVSPMLSRPSAGQASAADVLIANVRLQALTRAEALRLTVQSNGNWMVHSARTRLAVDSGSLSVSSTSFAIVLDALGRCIPAHAAVTPSAYDPLLCTTVPPAGPP